MDNKKWKPANEEERKAYFNQRILEQMELTMDDISMEIGSIGRWGNTNRHKTPIIQPGKNGDIDILVCNIEGNFIEYPAILSKTQQQSQAAEYANEIYKVTRLHPEHVEDGMKYTFPKGQGTHPFFPPKLIEKYKNREQIPMLILTEGYLKAMCGSMHGFDIVGLGSITHYAETGTRRLHKDIKKLIDRCQVKSVVILYDGDCINISLKDLERKEELTRRPHIFYSALLNTRELLMQEDVNIYFAHVLTDEFDVEDPPKGLDDLLLHKDFKSQRKEILDDLEGLSKRGKYFYKQNINGKVAKLQDYFYLRDVKQFYTQWFEYIQEKEFVYYGSLYKYDSAKKELNRIAPRELRNFLRAGDTYYEKVLEPSPLDPEILETRLYPRLKGTIIDDFGRSALEHIARYKGFVYIPRHKDYQQVIHDFYNRYFPIKWKEENVPFPHIMSLMKHVFGPNENGEDDQLELGLDYFQLLYQKPQQPLPILCVVSQERNTGKTTLLLLLRLIFGDNVALIDNDTMNSEFNSLFVGRLIIGIDESSFTDNKRVTEKLKNLSTAATMALNQKGKDQQIVSNFAKFVLTSNDISTFVKTDKNEIRFWVRELKPIKEEELIPKIRDFFEEEIPGFLFFLNNRKLSVPKEETRMWFKTEQIHTSALDRVVNDNKPMVVKVLEEALTNLFMNFPQRSYYVTPDALAELKPKLKDHEDEIRTYLREYFHATEVRNNKGVHTTSYVKLPYYAGSKKEKVEHVVDKNRAFNVTVENVLNEVDCQYVIDQVEAKEALLIKDPNNTN